MSDELPDTIRFSDRRDEAASDTQVRCPRCNKLIFMNAQRCGHCGLHFAGEAWEFSSSARSRQAGSVFGLSRWWIVTIALALVLAIVFAYF
jgi:hypothetical protein